MKNIMLKSARLTLRPKTFAEMEAIRSAEPDAEMKKAYGEMIDAMHAAAGQEEWASDWVVSLSDGTSIGGIGFKGAPDKDGLVDVGYGIDEAFRCHGYATEATIAMTEWALCQPGVKGVTTQTDPSNAISQKVLATAGFVRDGMGDEGPRFIRKK